MNKKQLLSIALLLSVTGANAVSLFGTAPTRMERAKAALALGFDKAKSGAITGYNSSKDAVTTYGQFAYNNPITAFGDVTSVTTLAGVAYKQSGNVKDAIVFSKDAVVNKTKQAANNTLSWGYNNPKKTAALAALSAGSLGYAGYAYNTQTLPVLGSVWSKLFSRPAIINTGLSGMSSVWAKVPNRPSVLNRRGLHIAAAIAGLGQGAIEATNSKVVSRTAVGLGADKAVEVAKPVGGIAATKAARKDAKRAAKLALRS
ncbi:MAG: hypothetical protein ACJAZS_000779 [Alteromonas naphthalenivorans]|jgi:hypothetical protein